jgi:hypothetical protein
MKKEKNKINFHKYWFLSFIIVFFFLISGNSLIFAQKNIGIKDTILYHDGFNSNVPVYSDINLQGAVDLTVKFRINLLLIDVKSISAGVDFGVNETSPSFKIVDTNLTESILEVSASNFNISNNGILFNIVLETLAGPDSVTFIEPFEVKINGVIDNSIILEKGKIVIGIPVYPIINEGIQEVFPNPFSYDGTVQFSIRDNTKIKFTMYSSNGRLVGTIPGESAFKYWFYDKKNVLIPDITNYTFTRGYYKFNFEVIDWKFASGLYSLVLETNRGVYETKLLLLK